MNSTAIAIQQIMAAILESRDSGIRWKLSASLEHAKEVIREYPPGVVVPSVTDIVEQMGEYKLDDDVLEISYLDADRSDRSEVHLSARVVVGEVSDVYVYWS